MKTSLQPRSPDKKEWDRKTHNLKAQSITDKLNNSSQLSSTKLVDPIVKLIYKLERHYTVFFSRYAIALLTTSYVERFHLIRQLVMHDKGTLHQAVLYTVRVQGSLDLSSNQSNVKLNKRRYLRYVAFGACLFEVVALYKDSAVNHIPINTCYIQWESI